MKHDAFENYGNVTVSMMIIIIILAFGALVFISYRFLYYVEQVITNEDKPRVLVLINEV